MAKVIFDKKKAMMFTTEAQKRLIAVGYELEGIIKRSMREGTGRIYGRHQASAPGEPPAPDTGRLRASISTNWTGSPMSRGIVLGRAKVEDGVGRPGSKRGMFTVVVGTNVEYANHLEMGTIKMAPRPFLRPAFDQVKNRVSKIMVMKESTKGEIS